MSFVDELKRIELEKSEMQDEFRFEKLFVDSMDGVLRHRIKQVAETGKSSYSGYIYRDLDGLCDIHACEEEEAKYLRFPESKSICHGCWTLSKTGYISPPYGYKENDTFIVNYLTERLKNMGFKSYYVKILYPRVKKTFYETSFWGKRKEVTKYEENDGSKRLFLHVSW